MNDRGRALEACGACTADRCVRSSGPRADERPAQRGLHLHAIQRRAHDELDAVGVDVEAVVVERELSDLARDTGLRNHAALVVVVLLQLTRAGHQNVMQLGARGRVAVVVCLVPLILLEILDN